MTGNGLPATVNNLTVNNGAGVGLTAGPLVSGTLTLASGALSIGANTLTINGAIVLAGGSLTGGTSANIAFGGFGPATTLPAVTLNSLTVNCASGIALAPTVTVNGTLALTLGAVTSAGNLTLGNGAIISRVTGSLDAAPKLWPLSQRDLHRHGWGDDRAGDSSGSGECGGSEQPDAGLFFDRYRHPGRRRHGERQLVHQRK